MRLHLEAEGLLGLALWRFGLELRFVVVDPQRVLIPDEVGRARLLQQRLEVATHAQRQIGAGGGDGLTRSGMALRPAARNHGRALGR